MPAILVLARCCRGLLESRSEDALHPHGRSGPEAARWLEAHPVGARPQNSRSNRRAWQARAADGEQLQLKM